MSDIKRYGVWDKPPREDLVTYADHEAAIALRTRVCAEAFEDELARTEERVLADAKARIEDINIEHHVMPHRHDDYALFEVALNCARAALTQPQTEKLEVGEEFNPRPDTTVEWPDGGGAATAAGAFDPDPLANPDCQECGNDDAGCLACGADANWDS